MELNSTEILYGADTCSCRYLAPFQKSSPATTMKGTVSKNLYSVYITRHMFKYTLSPRKAFKHQPCLPASWTGLSRVVRRGRKNQLQLLIVKNFKHTHKSRQTIIMNSQLQSLTTHSQSHFIYILSIFSPFLYYFEANHIISFIKFHYAPLKDADFLENVTMILS